jgi:hypothetical protein
LSTENTTSLQTEVNRKAQVAIDDIISRLRGGSLVLEGYTDSISFIDEDGNTVHYWLEGGRLLRNLEGGAPPPTVPLASDVSQLGFEYYVRRGEPATTAGEAGLVAVSLEVTRERHSCLLRSAVKLRNK